MFAALHARLKTLQELPAKLDGAAIAVATVLRNKVKSRKRAAGKARKAKRLFLRASGLSPREVRARVRKGRGGSGISIDATVQGDRVVLSASDQVQHFRRVRGETAEILAAFRRSVLESAGVRARGVT